MGVQISSRRTAGYGVVALVLVGLWWVVSASGPYAAVVPSPSELGRQMWADRAFYGPNVRATLGEAAQGFVWGNLLAVAAALLASRYRVLQRMLERFAVTAIALPLVAVAPLLSILYDGHTSSVILAAQSVVFMTVASVLLGLRSVSASAVDVIRAAGGDEWTVLRRARIPAALPHLVGGLQIAAPSAILGAIVGEYLGASQGLGVAMIQAQGAFEVARLWGLLIITSVLAAVFYLAIPLAARALIPALRSVETTLGSTERRDVPRSTLSGLLGGLTGMVATLVTILVAWWLLVTLVPQATSIARGPDQVIPYLVHGTTTLSSTGAASERALMFMLQQLVHTLADTSIGLVFGVVLALVISIAAFEIKAVESVILAVSVALRSIPMLAIIPLLALVFGRGLLAVTVLIGVMTFFPTVVNVLLAMRSIPSTAEDILRAAGAPRWQTVLRLRIPYALPGLLASVKVAIPVSIGAAMVAEWLSTGSGLGATLTVASAVYDYDFIWGSVFLILLTSLAAYHLAAAAEARLTDRRS
ncbi:hypothetical protein GCM10028801_08250 [Nocardioides maradonensis]